MRVLIAPDKFKGTLTAREAAEAIAEGWRKIRPNDELDLFPISDGGDGFGEILGGHLHAEERRVETVDAAHRPIQAKWWFEPDRGLAIVESAQVIGLAMLPPGQFHPFDLDTFGLGEVFRAVATARPRLLFVGIGGSATNDGGFGMARSLGWRFLDASGAPIEKWMQLRSLARIERPKRELKLPLMKVAMDVRNRLLGVRGATQIYGPQKGLLPADIKPAEQRLRRLALVMDKGLGGHRTAAKRPGAGAAGGLGYGLSVFMCGRLTRGFKLFQDRTGLKDRIEVVDLVLTGEGAIDISTVAMGKGVGGLARLSKRKGIPCLALAGVVTSDSRWLKDSFSGVCAMAPTLTTREEAMAQPAFWLRELASRISASWTDS